MRACHVLFASIGAANAALEGLWNDTTGAATVTWAGEEIVGGAPQFWAATPAHPTPGVNYFSWSETANKSCAHPPSAP
jgi:hypothetical protein